MSALVLGWWDVLSWFGADPPKAPPPPTAPSDTSAAEAAARARRDAQMRRGRRASILAGGTPEGSGSPIGTPMKQRLGE